MVIKIFDIGGGADTGDQGAAVFARVLQSLRTDDVIVVSFDGVNTATSSFVNAAFVPLLGHLSLDLLKRRLKIIRSTRQINDMIKTRLEREARLTAA